jgi:hypothetical protein
LKENSKKSLKIDNPMRKQITLKFGGGDSKMAARGRKQKAYLLQ